MCCLLSLVLICAISTRMSVIRKRGNVGIQFKIQDGVPIVVRVLVLNSRRFPLVKKEQAHGKENVLFLCLCFSHKWEPGFSDRYRASSRVERDKLE